MKKTLLEDKPLKEYFSRIDFSLWEDEMSYCFHVCNNAKSEKERARSSLKIYGTYLQLIEIFWINAFVISSNDLQKLFVQTNQEFRSRVTEHSSSEEFMDYLLDNWIFGFKDKSAINDYRNKKILYKNFFRELTNDYLQDFDLLNAYKHGFRVLSHGSANVTISSDANPSVKYPVDQYTGSVVYFSKGKDPAGRPLIYQNHLLFKWERVLVKSEFVLNFLENSRKVLLADGESAINLTTLKSTDAGRLMDAFGVMRVKTMAFYC